ncbi:MAG: histidine kinase [Frankiales bacterium]|nr:histidine kinase [Frankiales bacterium]
MTTSPLPVRRLVRAADGRVLGGVAAGLAELTGLPVAALRVAFVVLSAASGLGIAAYAVFWVFLPQADGTTFRADRRAQAQLLGLLALTVVALALLVPLGLLPGGTTTAPVLAAVAGVALVWQQADVAQRARWRASATSSRTAMLRLGVGALLLVGGLVGFLASRGQLAVARAGLLSTAVVVVGLVLLSSPWWFAMTTDLRAERRERIRSQERAEVAAHLHDSVLQTLALIQKAAASPAEVTRLARGQERELRTWLYASRSGEGTLSLALESLAAEVEEAHQVPVEVVAVGDLELDERSTALLAATREAVLNAARHSGAAAVDVYAEVEPGLVSVFVRDRGGGFDPEAVPDDRHGLAGSVVGRMTRHGGSAVVRSAPGEGTEVRLELPLGEAARRAGG